MASAPDKKASGTPLKSALKSPKKVRFETAGAGTAAPTFEKQPTVTTFQTGSAPSAPGLFVHTSENPSLALGLAAGTSDLNSDFRVPNTTLTPVNNHFG